MASLSFTAATGLSSCCACILKESPCNKPNFDQSLAADLWSAPAPIIHAAGVNDSLVDGLFIALTFSYHAMSCHVRIALLMHSENQTAYPSYIWSMVY
jgi:hypothetical protein